jgi:hypothetical protein
MAEILGLGLSHYPPLCLPDADMASLLSWTLQDTSIPESARDPKNWPAAMRAEWAEDRGARAAAAHRKALVAGFERVRAALDVFKPDAVVIWGDDQYENFKEDVIPPYAVLAYDDLNVWGEDGSMQYRVRGRPDIARQLVTGLLEQDIDVAYAYKPLHHASLAHAFTNAILYLDYHRKGYEHPTICFPLNCYGRKVVSAKGFVTRMDTKLELDPPSPSPRRFMQVGAATARVLKASPWRVALVASSSWSHAFLCDPTFRLRPDTPADRKLYEAMCAGDYETWRATSLTAVEDAGQQEVLNWFALAGAMEEIGARLEWSTFVESCIFNSNKVFAVYAAA